MELLHKYTKADFLLGNHAKQENKICNQNRGANKNRSGRPQTEFQTSTMVRMRVLPASKMLKKREGEGTPPYTTITVVIQHSGKTQLIHAGGTQNKRQLWDLHM